MEPKIPSVQPGRRVYVIRNKTRRKTLTQNVPAMDVPKAEEATTQNNTLKSFYENSFDLLRSPATTPNHETEDLFRTSDVTPNVDEFLIPLPKKSKEAPDSPVINPKKQIRIIKSETFLAPQFAAPQKRLATPIKNIVPPAKRIRIIKVKRGVPTLINDNNPTANVCDTQRPTNISEGKTIEPKPPYRPTTISEGKTLETKPPSRPQTPMTLLLNSAIDANKRSRSETPADIKALFNNPENYCSSPLQGSEGLAEEYESFSYLNSPVPKLNTACIPGTEIPIDCPDLNTALELSSPYVQRPDTPLSNSLLSVLNTPKRNVSPTAERPETPLSNSLFGMLNTPKRNVTPTTERDEVTAKDFLDALEEFGVDSLPMQEFPDPNQLTMTLDEVFGPNFELPEVEAKPADIPTMKKFPTIKKVPTMNKVQIIKNIPIINKVPTNNKVTKTKKVTKIKKVPTMNKVPIMSKLPTMNKVPTTSKVPTINKVTTMNRVPTMNKVPTMNRVPTMNKVTTMNKGPKIKKVPTVQKAPIINSTPIIFAPILCPVPIITQPQNLNQAIGIPSLAKMPDKPEAVEEQNIIDEPDVPEADQEVEIERVPTPNFVMLDNAGQFKNNGINRIQLSNEQTAKIKEILSNVDNITEKELEPTFDKQTNTVFRYKVVTPMDLRLSNGNRIIFKDEEVEPLENLIDDQEEVYERIKKVLVKKSKKIEEPLNKKARLTADKDRVIPNKVEATGDKTRVTANKVRVTAEKVRVTAEKVRVTTDKDRVTANKVEATGDKAIVTAEKVRVTTDKDRVTVNKVDDTGDKAKVTAENVRVTSGKDSVTENKAEDTGDKATAYKVGVTAEEVRVTTDKDRVTANKVEDTGDKARVTAENVRVTSGKDSVTANKAEDTGDKATAYKVGVTTEEVRVTTDRVTANKVEDTGDKARVTAEKVRVTSGKDSATANKSEDTGDKATAYKVGVTAEEDRVTTDKDRVTANKVEDTGDKARVTAENVRVTSGKDSATANKAEDTGDKATAYKVGVTAEEVRATTDKDRVSANKVEDTGDKARVTAEKVRVTSGKDSATANKVGVTAEKDRVTANKVEATGDKSIVTAEQVRVTTDKDRVTANKVEDTGDKTRITANKVGVAAEKVRVTAEQVRVTSGKDSATANKAEDTVDKARVTAEKVSVTADKVEDIEYKARVTANKVGVTAEKLKVTSGKNKFTANKVEDIGYKARVTAKKVKTTGNKVGVTADKVVEPAPDNPVLPPPRTRYGRILKPRLPAGEPFTTDEVANSFTAKKVEDIRYKARVTANKVKATGNKVGVTANIVVEQAPDNPVLPPPRNRYGRNLNPQELEGEPFTTDEVTKRISTLLPCLRCPMEFRSMWFLQQHYVLHPSHMPSNAHKEIFECLKHIVHEEHEPENKITVLLKQLHLFITRLRLRLPCILTKMDADNRDPIINEEVASLFGVEPGHYKVNAEGLKCIKRLNRQCVHTRRKRRAPAEPVTPRTVSVTQLIKEHNMKMSGLCKRKREEVKLETMMSDTDGSEDSEENSDSQDEQNPLDLVKDHTIAQKKVEKTSFLKDLLNSECSLLNRFKKEMTLPRSPIPVTPPNRNVQTKDYIGKVIYPVDVERNSNSDIELRSQINNQPSNCDGNVIDTANDNSHKDIEKQPNESTGTVDITFMDQQSSKEQNKEINNTVNEQPNEVVNSESDQLNSDLIAEVRNNEMNQIGKDIIVGVTDDKPDNYPNEISRNETSVDHQLSKDSVQEVVNDHPDEKHVNPKEHLDTTNEEDVQLDPNLIGENIVIVNSKKHADNDIITPVDDQLSKDPAQEVVNNRPNKQDVEPKEISLDITNEEKDVQPDPNQIGEYIVIVNSKKSADNDITPVDAQLSKNPGQEFVNDRPNEQDAERKENSLDISNEEEEAVQPDPNLIGENIVIVNSKKNADNDIITPVDAQLSKNPAQEVVNDRPNEQYAERKENSLDISNEEEEAVQPDPNLIGENIVIVNSKKNADNDIITPVDAQLSKNPAQEVVNDRPNEQYAERKENSLDISNEVEEAVQPDPNLICENIVIDNSKKNADNDIITPVGDQLCKDPAQEVVKDCPNEQDVDRKENTFDITNKEEDVQPDPNIIGENIVIVNSKKNADNDIITPVDDLLCKDPAQEVVNVRPNEQDAERKEMSLDITNEEEEDVQPDPNLRGENIVIVNLKKNADFDIITPVDDQLCKDLAQEVVNDCPNEHDVERKEMSLDITNEEEEDVQPDPNVIGENIVIVNSKKNADNDIITPVDDQLCKDPAQEVVNDCPNEQDAERTNVNSNKSVDSQIMPFIDDELMNDPKKDVIVLVIEQSNIEPNEDNLMNVDSINAIKEETIQNKENNDSKEDTTPE